MDLHTTLSKRKQSSRKKWWLSAILILLSITVVAMSMPDKYPRIEQASIRTSPISQGPLEVNVFGYGKLKSKFQRMLTTHSRAVVEVIYHYPGAQVSADTVILSLSAPEVVQAEQQARLELAQVEAELQRLLIQHQSDLLARDAQLAILNSELENASLKVEAEQQLISQGIVSALEFKRSQLSVKQLSMRLDIESRRRAQLETMQAQQIGIQQGLVSQYQNNHNVMQMRVDDLQVKAGMDGVVQRMSVEIGQSLTPGAPLTVIGSTHNLLAQISVQQTEADAILVGMPGSIITRGQSIAARVTRIDPVVTDGRVLLEMELSGVLPAGARPELTVEGQIKLATIEQALFAERPSNVSPHSSKSVFLLSNQSQIAKRVRVVFGEQSGNQIQILEGAKPGDTLIVSDMARFLDSHNIEIVN